MSRQVRMTDLLTRAMARELERHRVALDDDPHLQRVTVVIKVGKRGQPMAVSLTVERAAPRDDPAAAW